MFNNLYKKIIPNMEHKNEIKRQRAELLEKLNEIRATEKKKKEGTLKAVKKKADNNKVFLRVLVFIVNLLDN